jgi:hypothetical protein
MIMPLGWGEVTEIIFKLVTKGPFWFPTLHLWLRHLWIVGNPNGDFMNCWELFFPFTSGLPTPSSHPKGIKTILVTATS